MQSRIRAFLVTGVIAFVAASAFMGLARKQWPDLACYSLASAFWAWLFWPVFVRAGQVDYLRASAFGIIVPVLGLWLGLTFAILLQKSFVLENLLLAPLTALMLGIVGLAVTGPFIVPLGLAGALLLGWLHNRQFRRP